VTTNLIKKKVFFETLRCSWEKRCTCLCNNVIEETTYKLVEIRKRKVKATVGVVETVISLQDGKPLQILPLELEINC
jgi:hypothetical protein